MQTAHMQALEAKHAGIDQRLVEETHRPLPDASFIARLKKEKLRLKDEMTGH